MILAKYSKTCVNGHPQKDRKLVFKINCCLTQVKSIAEWEHSAILSTFIMLPFVIKIFVLSICEWPFYTGFPVPKNIQTLHDYVYFSCSPIEQNWTGKIKTIILRL